MTDAITSVRFPAGQLVHRGVPGAYHTLCGARSPAKNPLERAHAKVTCWLCEVGPDDLAREEPPEPRRRAKSQMDPALATLLKDLGV